MPREHAMRLPKNPKPKEWLAKDHSLQYIADYKPFNFVDGEGSAAVSTSVAAFLTVLAVTTRRLKTSTTASPTPRSWRTRSWRTSPRVMSRA